jgi:hypothetical protein
MTDGDIICADCADKQIEDYLKDTGQDFDSMMDAALAKWETEHGTKPDAWQSSRIYDDVEEARNEAALKFLDLDPLIQYTLDSDEGFAEEGLYCADCNTELVEPTPVDEDEQDFEQFEEWRPIDGIGGQERGE